jgi:hypothetical protein
MGLRNRFGSSDPRARARVRLVNSRRAPWRHTREGDVKDVGDRAHVKDVIHFAGSLDECLPRAVTAAVLRDRAVVGAGQKDGHVEMRLPRS